MDKNDDGNVTLEEFIEACLGEKKVFQDADCEADWCVFGMIYIHKQIWLFTKWNKKSTINQYKFLSI